MLWWWIVMHRIGYLMDGGTPHGWCVHGKTSDRSEVSYATCYGLDFRGVFLRIRD
jgi:hypothetical protein